MAKLKKKKSQPEKISAFQVSEGGDGVGRAQRTAEGSEIVLYICYPGGHIKAFQAAPW